MNKRFMNRLTVEVDPPSYHSLTIEFSKEEGQDEGSTNTQWAK